MRRHIVPGLVRTAQRAVVPLAVARTFEDAALLASLREALAREDRFPLSLMMALRAAFRHLRLHVFKAGQGRGVNFVTSTPPFPLAAARVVKPIEELLADLHVHPGCTRAELLARLHPGEPDNSEANREVLSHLNWLIDKGHVIEFFNGTLAVPLARSEAVGAA